MVTMVEEEKEENTEVGAAADVYALEILSYLPAKKVQTFESVCRDWQQLIRSSYFVRLHYSRSISRRTRILVTQLCPPLIIEYNNDDHQKDLVRSRIAIPPLFSKCPMILGSADGLIFMRGEVSRKVCVPAVFNPSTGKCRIVHLSPRPNHVFICSWFGSIADGEYIFVVVPSFYNSVQYLKTWVYKFTLGSNVDLNLDRSTLIGIKNYFCVLQDYGTLAQRVVYWPIRIEPMGMPLEYKILGYRLRDNKHVLILPPPGALCENLSLGLFVDGRSLLATSYKRSYVIEIWILKRSRSWTKHANIGIGKFETMRPLGFFPNGDFIMDVDKNRLMKYSFKDKESTLLVMHGLKSDRVIMCADSLVSP